LIEATKRIEYRINKIGTAVTCLIWILVDFVDGFSAPAMAAGAHREGQ
jgi:hypothetical protein